MNPEHVKCPVCLEIFDGKVFILKCGHNLCSTCLQKLLPRQDVSDSDYDDYADDEDETSQPGLVKCPVCKLITRRYMKSDGRPEGITRNVTIESIAQDYREKNGLLTSLDKERKDNLLKKGQKMKTELDDKLKFLETAEKLLPRKGQILDVRNSIDNLLDDFTKNSENESPQALRSRMNMLEKQLSNKMENEVFELMIERTAGTDQTPPNIDQRSFSNLKDRANYHQIQIKDGEQVETVLKHVGPIWGQYEAATKVRRYMESSGMKNWEWTGHWNSEGGTSYAYFQRKVNQ